MVPRFQVRRALFHDADFVTQEAHNLDERGPRREQFLNVACANGCGAGLEAGVTGHQLGFELFFAFEDGGDLALMLGLAQDGGYVRVEPRTRETSMRGVYAGGDLAAGGMKALLSAADGMVAAQSITEALTLEDALAAR